MASVKTEAGFLKDKSLATLCSFEFALIRSDILI